jgi:glycosyltransferase involved in cell wall biosynthesis
VNIWREVQAAGAGLVAADTIEGTTNLLTGWLSLTSDQRQAMRHAARELFHRRYTVDAMAQDLLDVVAV